jgi:hypothetical protein
MAQLPALELRSEGSSRKRPPGSCKHLRSPISRLAADGRGASDRVWRYLAVFRRSCTAGVEKDARAITGGHPDDD